jgi:hypothetical protein
MPDPTISRDPLRMEEVYAQGRITGVTITAVARHGGHTITIQDVHSIPVDDQVFVEDWIAQKPTWGPSLVAEGTAALNIEVRMARAIVEYIDSLDP